MDKDTERWECFNAVIHSLGFGKNSSVLENDTMKYGGAMPKAKNKKMLIEISIDD
ncbi:MAG: hypothetical protein ACR5K2_01760 [Wolbachia sp.]